MIEKLQIRNFAIIENLEINFHHGFNVITGETGAGKTIIMQAVNLLLGERASKEILRDNSEPCEISAEFSLTEQSKKDLRFLEELGLHLEDDEPLIIRRIITCSSTKNYINDIPVSVQTLKNIGDILIDTHGPHEHQSLLKNITQLNAIDRYAGLEKDLNEYSDIYKQWQDALKLKENFEKDLPPLHEEEFLRHTVNEIKSALPLSENELEEITAKHRLIANAKNILDSTYQIIRILADSEDSILEKIFIINKLLFNLEKFDQQKSAEFSTDIHKLREKVSELSDKLQSYVQSIETDEREFIRLEERLKILNTLKRKYGPEIKDVLLTLENAEKKLALIVNSGEMRKSIDAKIAESFEKLKLKAKNLSEKRQKASAKFAKEVKNELDKLGFKNAKFSVAFSEIEISPLGIDRIEFMFSANPGEEEKPLRNIASSGEISRTMLALKTVLASADSIPILIFDEIDSNIGGLTANIVGKELANLAKNKQLICISHLPQVASQADRHFVVEKKLQGKRTITEIKELSKEHRILELARMLGGTEAAVKHAEDLIKTKK